MHPIVALALVVAALPCLFSGGWADIALTASVCLPLLARTPSPALPELFRTLWRLRFFYLALLVLYGWFSPGSLLVPALGPLSPSLAGLVGALRYIAVLMVVTLVVQLLLACCGRESLAAALCWWLRPLRPLGLEPERIALRLILVATVLPRLRLLAAEHGEPERGPWWRRIAGRVMGVFERALAEAESVPPPRLLLPVLSVPGPGQWLLAAMLVAVLIMV